MPKIVTQMSGTTTTPVKPKKQTKAQRTAAESQQALEKAKPKVATGKTYRDVMTELLGGKLHLLAGGWNEDTGTPNVIELPPDLDLKITGRMARGLLGWETEPEYTARMLGADPSLTEESEGVKFEDSLTMPPSFKFGCNPKEQVKVVCWHNDRNRPIELRRCEEFAQTILQRQWAGPSTLGSINGESGVIGATGQPLSLQHCLVGLLTAIDIWNNQEKWRENWPEEPFIEKLVVLGISEDARIVQSIDNVRPRSLSDELYVGDDFRDLIPSERREIARMGERAISFLWDRTEAEETTRRIGTKRDREGGMLTTLTHSVAREFLGRHEKLKKALRFIFQVNRNRGIVHLGSKQSLLSPGQCAAMLYLMACSSTTDVDEYRNMELPSEKALDFDERWDVACRFWSELAMPLKDGFKTEDKIKWLRLEPVRHAIRALSDPEGLTSGNLLEKVNVLALAWPLFLNGEEIGSEHLEQTFFDKGQGEVVLVNRDTFGGIDCCHVPPPNLTKNKTPEELAAEAEKVKEENRKKEVEAHQKSIDDAKARQQAAKPVSTLPNIDNIKLPDKPKSVVNGKPLTSKQIQAAQTAKAKAADEAKGKQPLKGGIGG